MSQNIYRKIIDLIKEAQSFALSIGIPNILQPGLVKEMMIADLLGHEVIFSKRNADARDPNNHSNLYEYLSCKEGGNGQLDSMFKEPHDMRVKSLERITRNKMIYYAVFYENDQLKLKIIYAIEPKVLLKEAERQLDVSRNPKSHCNFSNNWAAENGIIVYEDKPKQIV